MNFETDLVNLAFYKKRALLLIPYNAMILAGMFSFASNIRSINSRFFVPSSGGKSGAARSFFMGTGMALTFFFTYAAGICAIFSMNPFRAVNENTKEKGEDDSNVCAFVI